jgi:hypothetical protein
MANLPWLERLARHLDRQRVPRPWRQRLLEELRDHLADLQEERGQMMEIETVEARLGDAGTIAQLAGNQYRKLGFWPRRPALTFLLGPIVTVVLAMTVYMLVIAGVGKLALEGRPEDKPLSAREIGLLSTAAAGARFVPFALVACLFGLLARRWSVRAAWPLTGCAVLGVLAGQMHTAIQVPDPNLPHGQVMVGLALNLMHLATHLPQVAVPLVVGAVFLLPRRSVAT